MIPQAGHYRASTKSVGDPDDIQRLADILSKSTKPCVLLGQQVWTCGASETAREFVERLNIPAYMNGAGRGTLPPDHPLNFQLTRRDAFEAADVIVVVGTPFDFRLRYGKSLKSKTVVQIDMSYATVGRNRDVDLGLVGDVGAILAAVAQAAGAQQRTPRLRATPGSRCFAQKKTRRLKRVCPNCAMTPGPIHPYRLAYEIDKFLTDNSIFVGDGGDVVTFAGNVVRPKGPGLWMDPGPLGTLGVGTGFAMAAKLAHPEKRSRRALWRRLVRDDRLRHANRDPVRACRTSRSSATTRT